MAADKDLEPQKGASTALRPASLYQNIESWFAGLLAICFAGVLTSIFRQPKPPSIEEQPLDGKTAIVTGANGGLGLALSRDLLRRGCTVIMACRSLQRAQEARTKILSQVKNAGASRKLEIMVLDNADLDSVRGFAKNWSRRSSSAASEIDYLFLNAGFAERGPDMSRFNKDGLEIFYVTNFLSQFLLVNVLLPFLSPSARIVLTASYGAFFARFSPTLAQKSTKNTVERGFHYPDYFSFTDSSAFGRLFGGSQDSTHYAQTKGLQVVFADMLQQLFTNQKSASLRIGDENSKEEKKSTPNDVRVTSFHPGIVKTGIFDVYSTKSLLQSPVGYGGQYLMSLAGLEPEDGICTALCLALSDNKIGKRPIVPGAFYEFDVVRNLPWYGSLTPELRLKLWTRFNNDAGLTDADWNLSRKMTSI